MVHHTMENLLPIKINDLVWTDQDQEDIIKTTLQMCMETCRKYKRDPSQKNATSQCDHTENILIPNDSDSAAETDSSPNGE